MEGGVWREAFSEAAGCWKPLCRGFYPVLRVVLFLIQLGFVVHSIVEHVTFYHGGFSYWLIKLTHWCAVLQLVYFGFAMFVAIKLRLAPNTEDVPTPWYVRVTWALSTIVPAIVFIMCALFWGLVFKGNLYVVSVTMHGCTFALCLVDIFSTAMPFYLRHIYMPMLFAILYISFSVIYHAAGGTDVDGAGYIYKALDWSDPSGPLRISAMVVFVAVPIVHAAFFLLIALRERCARAGKSVDVASAQADEKP